MARVFISYSIKDKCFAERLSKDLRAGGVNVWVDFWEIRVGDSLIEKIQSALSESDFVVAVLSRHSIESKWVREELNSAKLREIESGSRLLLPVLTDDCSRPPFLAHKRFADFRASYENGLLELLAAIGVEQIPVIRFLNGAVTIRELLDRTLEALMSRFSAHSIHVLVRRTESHLERLVMIGGALDAKSKRFRLAMMSGMIGQAYRSGRQVYAPDVSEAEHYKQGDARTVCEVANPIRLPTGQVIGVLNIEMGQKEAFSALDLEFVQRVSEAIGWWLATHRQEMIPEAQRDAPQFFVTI